MPCYHPITGYVSRTPSKNGKFPIVFDHKKGWIDRMVTVPCGQCIGCRLERSRQWAIRCVHEASLYDRNCFITLTFNDENLPSDGSLHKEDFQKFMKRLRKKFGKGVRYFHCGEYGDQMGRPHHHACLFNFDFPDRVLYKCVDGVKLYRSEILESLWPFGFCTIGDVTFESAAYVARYVVKKVTGDPADAYYAGRVPEYITMSRRPGIATGWIEKFSSDVYPSDFVVIRNGIKCRPPKFYDAVYDLDNPEMYAILKRKREVKAQSPNNAPRKLRVRELIKKSKILTLKRGYENGS